MRDSSSSTWTLSAADLRAAVGDVRQVGLAARADLVDLLDFRLDGVNHLFAAGDGLDVLLELVGDAA